MKTVWKVLLSFGGLMVLYAIFMDTTVSRGGDRFHNIGLQQQQLMLLILGCVMFLAGIGLFGVVKVKQTKEEEEEEARSARERIQRAAAVVASWKEKSDQRVAAMESRRSTAKMRDPDRRPVRRLLAGLLTGATCFIVGVGATGSIGLGGALLLAAVVYSFWQGNTRMVIRRLMLANIVVASSLYCYGSLRSDTSMGELIANQQFMVATGLLFLLPLGISLLVLLKPERPRSPAGD